MLYIEKEGLPNDINRKIIELSKSEEWKNISEDDATAIRNAFDNDFLMIDKSDTEKALDELVQMNRQRYRDLGEENQYDQDFKAWARSKKLCYYV